MAMISRERLAVAIKLALRGVATALGAAGVFFVYRYVTGGAPDCLSYATGCLILATAITIVMERRLI